MNFEILVEPWKFLLSDEPDIYWKWIQFAVLYFLYQYFVFAEHGATIGWMIVAMIALSIFFGSYFITLNNDIDNKKSSKIIQLIHSLLFFAFYGFLIFIIFCRRIPELITRSFKRVLISLLILLPLLFSWIIPSFLILGMKSASIINHGLESA